MKTVSSRQPWVVLVLVGGAVISALGGSYWRDRVELGKIAPDRAMKAMVQVPTDPSSLVASTESDVRTKESELYYQVLSLVSQYYVDPKVDSQKMAHGAIRGMVNHLADPSALFLDEDQILAYRNTLQGNYEGVGAEFRLQYDQEKLDKYRKERDRYVAAMRKGEKPELNLDPDSLLPDLVVAAVLPGSPAEKAGLKAGAVIRTVDGLHVWSASMNKELEKVRDQLRDPKLAEDTIRQLRKEFQQKIDDSIMPGKALDKVSVGTKGEVKLGFKNPGDTKVTLSPSLQRSKTIVRAEANKDGFIHPYFIQGVADQVLKSQKDGVIKLDLRNLPSGDIKEVVRLLEALLPAGEYGYVRRGAGASAEPFKVNGKGNSEWKFEILTDSTTSGHSAIVAHALMKSGRARMTGPMPPALATIEELIELKSKQGYVLPVGVYFAEESK